MTAGPADFLTLRYAQVYSILRRQYQRDTNAKEVKE